mgnify:CR=1 FL=1
MIQPTAPSPRPRGALLVDGENISPSVAGQIILRALNSPRPQLSHCEAKGPEARGG